MDLDSNVDYGPQLNVLVWMLTSVSGLFLLARLYLKTCQNRGLWWDDWILLASWIALIASASIIAYVISLGYGKRLIPLANLPYFGLPVNILSTLMIITNLWGKTSFGMTLIRIPVPWMRFCVWYILVTLTLTLTASVVFVWVECGPLKLPGRCVPVDVSIRYNVFSCAYSAVVDIALALLPWRYLLSLEMSKKEKIGAGVAMSMGALAGATAAAKATTIPRVNAPDARASIPLLALGAAEAAVCIMAASIPILRALVRGNRNVPRGYQTGYPTTMTESGQIMSLSLPIHVPPPPRPEQELGDRDRFKPNSAGSDRASTLTMEVDGVPEHRKYKDPADEDSIEMQSYRSQPPSPVDFTRSVAS